MSFFLTRAQHLPSQTTHPFLGGPLGDPAQRGLLQLPLLFAPVPVHGVDSEDCRGDAILVGGVR